MEQAAKKGLIWHADYKGTRVSTGQQALVVERWLDRVEEDALGLTFQ